MKTKMNVRRGRRGSEDAWRKGFEEGHPERIEAEIMKLKQKLG